MTQLGKTPKRPRTDARDAREQDAAPFLKKINAMVRGTNKHVARFFKEGPDSL